MRMFKRSAAGAAILAATLFAACDRHSSDSGASSAPAIYSAELTAVAITRSADRKALPVTGLPAAGAKLAVW